MTVLFWTKVEKTQFQKLDKFLLWPKKRHMFLFHLPAFSFFGNYRFFCFLAFCTFVGQPIFKICFFRNQQRKWRKTGLYRKKTFVKGCLVHYFKFVIEWVSSSVIKFTPKVVTQSSFRWQTVSQPMTTPEKVAQKYVSDLHLRVKEIPSSD